MNARQAHYLRSINERELTVAFGPAGTSKTYVPSVRGAELLLEPDSGISKIILCRPAVAGGGEQHGFLPGDIRRKLEPWVAPVLDAIEESVGSKGKVDEMIKDGRIMTVPFQYMRGRTFKDAFVILDEAQNTTPEQMKMFVTRLGEGARTVISGDVSGGQSDLRGDSGLASLLALLDRTPSLRKKVGIIEFGARDVVRSGLCQEFVEAYQ